MDASSHQPQHITCGLTVINDQSSRWYIHGWCLTSDQIKALKCYNNNNTLLPPGERSFRECAYRILPSSLLLLQSQQGNRILSSPLVVFCEWRESFSYVFSVWGDLCLEGLQCQGNDPWHAAVEGFILQAHQAVKGQRSSSHHRPEPSLVQTPVVLGAQIHQHLKERTRGPERKEERVTESQSPRFTEDFSLDLPPFL